MTVRGRVIASIINGLYLLREEKIWRIIEGISDQGALRISAVRKYPNPQLGWGCAVFER